MFRAVASQSADLTLGEFIARLSAKDAVDGLFVIGSAGLARLTPASDYDLIVVLREMPVPVRVALTYVDHRLTDIIFVDAAEIDAIFEACPPSGVPSWDTAQLLRWLRAGQVVFDRTGQLQRVRSQAKVLPEAEPVDREIYSAWYGINYNLKHNHRLLASDESTYLTALDLRLLFSIHELWWYYFRIRKLPHKGEKEQVQYMETHDTAYLELFRRCLAESGRYRRFELYEELAHRAVAPVGGLWEGEVTAVLPEPGVQWESDTLKKALTFWQGLVQTEAG